MAWPRGELMIESRKYINDCISFLKQLVQTPSVNGKHFEEAIVQVIHREAEKQGLPAEIVAKDPQRPNIVVGGRLEDSHPLLLVAHTDTVTEGASHLWKFPPFSGHQEGMRLYGRGAIDCKGGVALSMSVLKALRDMNQLHRAKFVGVCDEESGASSPLGLGYLLEQNLKAEGAIYTYGRHGGVTESINIGHRGVLRVWVIFYGESVHSGSLTWQNATRGKNAIDALGRFLGKMQSFSLPGESRYFPGYRLIATPTQLVAGIADSIVPDEAKVLFDIRTLPEHTTENVLEEIHAIAQQCCPKFSYQIQPKFEVPAVLSPPDSPFIQTVQKIHQECFDIFPSLKGSGPANESYMLIKRGIPTIAGYGPSGEGAHSPNEYADIDSLEKSFHFLLKLALSF